MNPLNPDKIFINMEISQPAEAAKKHLRNSMWIFLRMVELSRLLNHEQVDALRASRDYEELNWLFILHLLNK